MAERATGQVQYAAVIGDIRSSRGMPDRAAVQVRLEATLDSVNAEFGDRLAAGFIVTLGDEFQGVLLRAADLVSVVNSVDAGLRGIPLRFAVGWGGVSTAIRERAVGIDGPCFHRAREAMTKGKRDGRWVTLSGFGELEDELLNAIFWLMGEVRAGWTDIQAETVAAARHAESQKAVAAARGRHTSTVSKALKSALFEPIMAAERAAAVLLSNVDAESSGEGR